MTQVPNYIVEDGDGLTVLAAINAIFAAVGDDNAGPTPPDNPFPFMRWRDTSVSPEVLKIRNAANTAWLSFLAYLGITLTAAQINSLQIPPGSVVSFARNSAPTGWLKANGALVSRTTYADLFAAIGTTFGVGDGSTTFALPDLRGEFIRGWDDGRGVDSGRVFGSAQLDQMQGHRHDARIAQGVTGTAAGTNEGIWNQGVSPISNVVINTITDGINGTPRTGAETRPRNVALLACIKF